MAEREFTDYDDWMAAGGDPTYGQGVSPIDPYSAPPPAAPPPGGNVALPPSGPPPPGTQWMLNPTTGQFEPIPIGTMPPWGPIASNPTPPPPPTSVTPPPPPPPQIYQGGNDYNQFGGDMGGEPSPFAWPDYTPTQFDPGPAFSYKDFTAPTGESMLKEPGFQFRMDQGRKALEASAAGKGILRSGGTLKDILGYGQNFAAQEYGNVYNRALTEYDTNRDNAFGNWSSQYGQKKDAYSFGEDNNRFDYGAKQRQAELDFQDLFNRWQTEGGWTKDIALGGMD